MQPLQQDLDPAASPLASQDQPMLREEVRLLRQRVATLEDALAAANAARPRATVSVVQARTSEFSQSTAPAVVAVQTEQQPAPAPEVVSDQGFADAWSDQAETSFEERIAQKAFFQVGTVDETSRNWLLTS